jgi:hypothetical protein
MKKKSTRLILTALIASTTTLTSYSQLDVKLNVDNTVDKRPEIALEAGADKFSIELINGIIFKKWGETTITDANGNETTLGVKRFGYNGMFKANYYFNPKNTLDGWHVSPYARYRFQNIKFDDGPTVNNRFGMGLIFGRKAMISEEFGYQVEAGLGYWLSNKYKIKATKEVTDITQDIPLFGDLVKKLDRFDLPINISVFYRFGG